MENPNANEIEDTIRKKRSSHMFSARKYMAIWHRKKRMFPPTRNFFLSKRLVNLLKIRTKSSRDKAGVFIKKPTNSFVAPLSVRYGGTRESTMYPRRVIKLSINTCIKSGEKILGESDSVCIGFPVLVQCLNIYFNSDINAGIILLTA
jgi:hypothetical protein